MADGRHGPRVFVVSLNAKRRDLPQGQTDCATAQDHWRLSFAAILRGTSRDTFSGIM
jgi:hypothetical protein